MNTIEPSWSEPARNRRWNHPLMDFGRARRSHRLTQFSDQHVSQTRMAPDRRLRSPRNSRGDV